MTFEELQERIDSLLKGLEASAAGAGDQQTDPPDVTQLMAAFKEGLDKVIDEVKGAEELEEMEDRIRRLEAMAEDRDKALKVLTAWKEQLAKAGVDVEDLKLEGDVEDILSKIEAVEIPNTEELQTKVETLEQENTELKSQIEESEKESLANERLEELKEAGVSIPEARLETTKAKIKEMDNEAFSEYKQELVDFMELNKAKDDDDDGEEPDAAYAHYRGRLVTEEKDPSDQPIADQIKLLFSNGRDED